LVEVPVADAWVGVAEGDPEPPGPAGVEVVVAPQAATAKITPAAAQRSKSAFTDPLSLVALAR
jgi:hypothetical protein